MTNTTYRFEELYNCFTSMTDKDIMQEYAVINKRYHELQADIKCDLEELEQIDRARDFLGHYLAISHCIENGFTS